MSCDKTKKAKVILLCGQSNMAGVARNSYLEKTVGAERAAKLIRGFDNIKIVYHAGGLGPSGEPYRQIPDRETANDCQTFKSLTAGCGCHRSKEFFGPELGIGEYLSEKYPDETFYLVKHSYGGCTIGDYLPDHPVACFVPERPDVKDILSLDSYGELRALFDKAVKQIKNESGLDVEVVAVCWMQGESEGGCSGYFSSTYKIRQQVLMANFRRDYAEFAPECGIAFCDAEINEKTWWKDYEIINGAKNEIASQSPMNFIVPTNAAGLTCANEPEEEPDIYHYDSSSMVLLGNLYGNHIADAIEAGK